MEIEQRIEKIRRARALIDEALAGCDIPQFESMLRDADMYLHWSLWNLGEDVALRPELERSPAAQDATNNHSGT
jgi:hypothetical protein